MGNGLDTPTPSVDTEGNPPATEEQIAARKEAARIANQAREAGDAAHGNAEDTLNQLDDPETATSPEAQEIADTSADVIVPENVEPDVATIPPESPEEISARKKVEYAALKEEMGKLTSPDAVEEFYAENKDSLSETRQGLFLTEKGKLIASLKAESLTESIKSAFPNAPKFVLTILALLPADIRKWIGIGADGFNDFIDGNDDKVMFANMGEVFEGINLPFTVDFSDKSIQESFAKLMEKIDSISGVEAKDKKTLLAVFKGEGSKELLDKVAPFSASVAALFSNRDMTEAKFLGAIKDPTVMVAEYKKDEDTMNA